MSSNTPPPHLHLTLPANATSFKRSFEQLFDHLESPGAGGSSGQSTIRHGERNKRARGSESDEDESSDGSYETSPEHSRSAETTPDEDVDDSHHSNSGAVRPPDDGVFASENAVRMPTAALDVEMSSADDFLVRRALATPPQQQPILDDITSRQDVFRSSLERYNAFDAQISALRQSQSVSPTPRTSRSTPVPPPINTNIDTPSTPSSTSASFLLPRSEPSPPLPHWFYPAARPNSQASDILARSTSSLHSQPTQRSAGPDTNSSLSWPPSLSTSTSNSPSSPMVSNRRPSSSQRRAQDQTPSGLQHNYILGFTYPEPQEYVTWGSSMSPIGANRETPSPPTYAQPPAWPTTISAEESAEIQSGTIEDNTLARASQRANMIRSANSSLSLSESNTAPHYWPRSDTSEENTEFDRMDEVIALPRAYRRSSDTHNNIQGTERRQGQAFTGLSDSLRRPSPFSIPITESMSMSSNPTSSSEELEPGLASDPREPVVGEDPRPTLSELLGPETAAGEARYYGPGWRPPRNNQPRFLTGLLPARRWWGGSEDYHTGDRHAGTTESQPRDLSSTIRSRAQMVRAAASRTRAEAPPHPASRTYSSSSGSSTNFSSPNRAPSLASMYSHRALTPSTASIPAPPDVSRSHRFPIQDQSDNDENHDPLWPPSTTGTRPRWVDATDDSSYYRAIEQMRSDPQRPHGREDATAFANQYGGNNSTLRSQLGQPSPTSEDRNGNSSPERRRSLPFAWISRSRERERDMHMERMRRERERGEERTRMALSERIAQRFGPSSDERSPGNGPHQLVNERYRRAERLAAMSNDSSRQHDYRRSGRVGVSRDDRPPSRTHSRIDRFASDSERNEERHGVTDPNHPMLDGPPEHSYADYFRDRNIRRNEMSNRRLLENIAMSMGDMGTQSPPLSAPRNSVEYRSSRPPWSSTNSPELIEVDREPSSSSEYAPRPRHSSPSPTRPGATLQRLRTRMYSTRPGASNSLVSEAAAERRRRHARAQLLSELRSDVESPHLRRQEAVPGDHDMDDSSPWTVQDDFDWLIDPSPWPRTRPRSAILNESSEENRNLHRPSASSPFEIPPPHQARDPGNRSNPWLEAARANARSTQDRYHRTYEIAPFLYRDSQDEPMPNPPEPSSRRIVNPFRQHAADEVDAAATRIVDDLSPEPGVPTSSQAAAMFSSSPENPTFLDSNILPNHLRRSFSGQEAAPRPIFASTELHDLIDDGRDLDERPSASRSPFPDADLGARARLRTSLGSPDLFRPPSPMVEDRPPPRQPLPPVPSRPSSSTPQGRYSVPVSYRNVDLNAYHEGPIRASLQRWVDIDRIRSREQNQQSFTDDDLRPNTTSSPLRPPSLPPSFSQVEDWVSVNPPGAASPPPHPTLFRDGRPTRRTSTRFEHLGARLRRGLGASSPARHRPQYISHPSDPSPAQAPIMNDYVWPGLDMQSALPRRRGEAARALVEEGSSSGEERGLNEALDVLRSDGLSSATQQAMMNRLRQERSAERRRPTSSAPGDEDTSRFSPTRLISAARRRRDRATRPSAEISTNASRRPGSISPPGDSTRGAERSRARALRFGHQAETGSLFGEMPRLDLFSYSPFRRHPRRNMGDYMRDEDFDSSYENLLSLANSLGEVKPRSVPEHVIASLPTSRHKDWATSDSDQRCPICLDDYVATDPVMRLECSHWLHKGCLEQWLHGASTCPVCRKRVNINKRNSTGGSSEDSGPSGSGSNRRNDDQEGGGGPGPRRIRGPPWRFG